MRFFSLLEQYYLYVLKSSLFGFISLFIRSLNKKIGELLGRADELHQILENSWNALETSRIYIVLII